MSSGLAIVGVGETPPVRRSTRSVQELIADAVESAVLDAGMRPGEVDGVVVEGGLTARVAAPEDVARHLGCPAHTLTVQTSVGGAGLVGAPLIATAMIDAGLASSVVCYFGADWGSRRGGSGEFHTEDPLKAALETSYGFSAQPVYFAAIAERYRFEYGLTDEQLGAVAVAARQWAALSPDAVSRAPLTMADYLRSPMVAEPLRVLDCCLPTDGAAAYVMTSDTRARDCAHRPVRVAGCAAVREPVSSHSYFTQNPDYLSTPAVTSGPAAMKMAGVAAADIGIAQLYDCFTLSTILQLEDLGFCKKGEGGGYVEDGRIGPGGKVAVNTHGGLLSHSFLVGISHVLAAVRQLRGDADAAQVDTDVALATGLSGWEHATLVLTR